MSFLTRKWFDTFILMHVLFSFFFLFFFILFLFFSSLSPLPMYIVLCVINKFTSHWDQNIKENFFV